VDEDQRQIWFAASGMYSGQDPYFINYGRVNFDGTGLVMLTEGNGNHTIAWSPDKKYIIDTYSRVDMPPVNELRRVSDGKLVCKLEESDITELLARGFKTPEVFTAKGRDGVTDIWGIITRPTNFDAGKKYPVLESIYNGPQDSYVPKSFSAGGGRGGAYGQLGFIVVQCDAMGTANRSKAFHDVCWHNLGDGGFPDRIAWIKAAGARHPEMDLTRVGIFGTSAGGQNAAGAVIFHPEFYKAAVANSGCHDNRLDKASWNEQWMGYMPPDKIWEKSDDNWYSKSSNIDNADKLGAKLFLIVGEMDDNVPPESTLRLVDALIKAGKDFDFLEVPGANHGAGSRVTQRRTQDFFVQNLLGQSPPNRNAGESGPVHASN
jgi:dipeptidyl aminopeptidase/acylaminoacyl peptidase